jgi:hypothetical protein
MTMVVDCLDEANQFLRLRYLNEGFQNELFKHNAHHLSIPTF